MGHTNSTVNYNLPQFVGTDKPSWLGDVNGAFLAIDTAIAAAKTEADSAAGGVASLQTTVGSHTTQIGTLTNTVTAQGGTLNTVTALIGNGEPTTTDKTLIGAINELNAKIGADDLDATVDLSSYTSSGNMYEFPDDGYVQLGSYGANTTVVGHILGNSGVNGITVHVSTETSTAKFNTIAVPVKKGMKFYVDLGGGTGNSAYFIALV